MIVLIGIIISQNMKCYTDLGVGNHDFPDGHRRDPEMLPVTFPGPPPLRLGPCQQFDPVRFSR